MAIVCSLVSMAAVSAEQCQAIADPPDMRNLTVLT